MKPRSRQGAIVLLMARELGDRPICPCGATMLNYDTACLAGDEDCCGWVALVHTARKVEREHRLPKV